MSKKDYIVLTVSLGVIIFFMLLMSIAFPPFLLIVLIVAILEGITVNKLAKINKRQRGELVKEKEYIARGYQKICRNFFVKDSVFINNVRYDFSDIVNCERIEDGQNISNTYQRNYGKINRNNRIRMNTSSVSTGTNYCKVLYINITMNSITNPNVKLDFMGYDVSVRNGSKKYMQMKNEMDRAMSTLQIIISKNNTKYTSIFN